MLESIKHVDEVIVFETDSELRGLVYKLNPDVMIVGSDYKDKKVIGSEYAKSVEFFDRIGDYSTTKILERENENR